MTGADLVITGADVYCGSGAWASAVAIRHGRIVAVGSETDVRAEVGAAADSLHLPGRLVLPGFQDAHVHPLLAGKARATLSLEAVSGRPDYLRAIADYVDDHPGTDWIVGHGWSMEHFPHGLPDKADLDAIAPGRPVFLTSREYHTAWVNSTALERADITTSTPDPWDGRIEHDPDTGEPSGVVHEGVVMTFLNKHIPTDSQADRRAWLLDAQEHLHSQGITAWQDAWVSPQDFATYAELGELGLLTGRVVASLWWDRHRGMEQIEELVSTRQRCSSLAEQGLHASTVKIWLDGILDSQTGALLEPYRHCRCKEHPSGLMYLERDHLLRAVTELDKRGFQAHFHAIGDRAVRCALDAVEAALNANGPTDNRHHIAHLQLVHPSDIPRFAALDVTATCQALWAQLEPQMEEITLPALGKDRFGLQFPFASLARTGGRLAMGSDWPVTTPNPLAQIEVALTRVDPSRRDDPPFRPDEALTLRTAIDAFTAGSAYVNHDDRDAGSIATGKRADLAILDRNVFSDGGREIADASVEFTLAAGRMVYENR